MDEEIPTNTKNIDEPYKKDVYDTYVVWRSIPALFRQLGATEVAKRFGLDDEVALDLVDIHNQTEFAKKYGVENSTLTNWNKLIEKKNAIQLTRSWATKLTKNVVFALYKRAMNTGDDNVVRLWMQVVDGWKPNQIVDPEYKGIEKIEIFQYTCSHRDCFELASQDLLGIRRLSDTEAIT